MDAAKKKWTSDAADVARGTSVGGKATRSFKEVGVARHGRWVVVAAIVASATIGSTFATKLAGKCLDDLFITFRYAENLANGKGFVFNPGERTFSLTNPGLALLLSGTKVALGASIPELATWLTAVSLTLVCGILAAEGRRHKRTVEAVIGSLLIAGSSFVWASHGFEFLPALALVGLASQLILVTPLLAGALAGYAVWCRPEALIAVVLLGWFTRRELGVIPRRFMVGSGVVTAVGLLAATLYFGQPLPITLAAKLATVEIESAPWTGVRFWARSEPLLERHLGSLWWALAVLGIVGLVDVLRSGGRLERTLASFGICLGIAYPLMGIPFFPWYAVPTAVSVLYAVPFAQTVIVRAGAERSFRPTRTVAAALVTALAIGPAYYASYRWLADYQWPSYMAAYRQAGLWLRENTSPDTSVAYYEVGVLAYFSDRYVVDILGIVSPHLVPYVQSGDLASAFLAQPASFAMFHTRRGGRMPVDHPWFQRSYREIVRFQDGEEWLILFRRRRHTTLPAPAQVVIRVKLDS